MEKNEINLACYLAICPSENRPIVYKPFTLGVQKSDADWILMEPHQMQWQVLECVSQRSYKEEKTSSSPFNLFVLILWPPIVGHCVLSAGAITSDLYRFSFLDIWISNFLKLWLRHFLTQISIMDAQLWFISIVVKLTNISLTVFMEGHFWPMSRHEN